MSISFENRKGRSEARSILRALGSDTAMSLENWLEKLSYEWGTGSDRGNDDSYALLLNRIVMRIVKMVPTPSRPVRGTGARTSARWTIFSLNS